MEFDYMMAGALVLKDKRASKLITDDPNEEIKGEILDERDVERCWGVVQLGQQ